MRGDHPLRLRDVIAVGDSFTEGLSDERDADGRLLGWADRVVDGLAAGTPWLRYANVAVRGKLLDEVVLEQVLPALRLLDEPTSTLVTFHAGANDVLRPARDVDALMLRYDRAVRLLHDAHVQVLLFTVVPRAGGSGRTADWLAARFERFNAGVRESAQRYGARVADQAAVPALADRRLWDADRLHLNAAGHRRVAALVLATLGYLDEAQRLASDPACDKLWWTQPLPPAPQRSRRADWSEDARWLRVHLLPWVARRLRRTSSGEAVIAKDATLRPVSSSLR